MAKLTKNGSTVIFKDGDYSNQFSGTDLKVRYSLTGNVTISSNNLNFYSNKPLSGLLNESDIPYTESELQTFVGSFNMGGGGVTESIKFFQSIKNTTQVIQTVYEDVAGWSAPFIGSNAIFSFNENTGELLISEVGNFKLSYHIVAHLLGNNRVELNSILEANNVNIDESFDSQYIARNNAFDTGSCQISNFLYKVTIPNTIIKLKVRRQGTTLCEIINSRITIEKIN